MSGFPQVMWPLWLATLAIALISTAVVQLLKELFPIRRAFQRSFLQSWFGRRLEERSKVVTVAQSEAAEKDLIRLATGGDRDAFYDLETAQLCGQMNSAAQMAVAYPDRHLQLLRFLAPEADDVDLDLLAKSTESVAARATASPQDQAHMDALLDARNRITHHVQRGIDALQISMSFRWKFILQVIVYLICLVASALTILTLKPQGPYTFGEILIVAVVAGFLSPIISDFAAWINRLRKP
jgi:hypothetical protein